MNTARICGYAMMALRGLIGLPCIAWGLAIGVIGVGPDGVVSLGWRLVGLCFFFGGLALGFPLSLVRRRPLSTWLIVACSALPFSMLVLDQLKYGARRGGADLWDWILLAVGLAGILLTIAEAALSPRALGSAKE